MVRPLCGAEAGAQGETLLRKTVASTAMLWAFITRSRVLFTQSMWECVHKDRDGITVYFCYPLEV